jgi:hypothetical protein
VNARRLAGTGKDDGEDDSMCCDDLVCALCAGPVAEGRCASCRSARASLHQGEGFTLSPQLLAFVLLVLSAVALLAAHQAR